jgi:hypothetical protein
MKAAHYIDISADLLHDIERKDADVRTGTETMEVRAIATMLRRNGYSEPEIVAKFGYSPEPLPPRVRRNAQVVSREEIFEFF